MKIASIQLNIIWENSKINLIHAEQFIIQAKSDACDLIVLPEMFNSGFSMNTHAITEPSNGPSTQLLSRLAKKYEIYIIAGITEENHPKANNIALVINRKGIVLSKYIKNYPYSHAGEDKFYCAGSQQVIFKIEGIIASVFICYDLRFPELFRTLVGKKTDKQVEIIFIIASWPSVRQDHWQTLLKARAIENQCFIVGVNRIGKDGNGLNYIGGSQVYNPSGIKLSHGEKDQEYLVTEINPSEVSEIRKKLPFLSDIK